MPGFFHAHTEHIIGHCRPDDARAPYGWDGLDSPGEVGDKFYLIRKGQCEVRVADGQHQRVINTLGEGDFFGEMVLLTGDPRSATVVTTRVTEVYTLGKDDFDAILRASAFFKEQLLHVFFQRQ